MATILDTVLPFFALIFCGYGAARFKILDPSSAAGLNSFVFYFALPAFLFSLMSSSPIEEIVNVPFVLAYSCTSFVLFGLAALGGRTFFGVGKGEAAVLGLAGVLPNTSYMGIPLISTAFGNEAAAKGRDFQGPVENLWHGVDDRVFAGITEEEKLLLKELLARVRENLGAG